MIYELLFSSSVLCVGIIGIVMSNNNIIAILIGIEMMLLAANFNFIVSSVFLDDAYGFVFAMVSLTIAGVEAALGLSILICYYRLRGIITVSFMSALNG